MKGPQVPRYSLPKLESLAQGVAVFLDYYYHV